MVNEATTLACIEEILIIHDEKFAGCVCEKAWRTKRLLRSPTGVSLKALACRAGVGGDINFNYSVSVDESMLLFVANASRARSLYRLRANSNYRRVVNI